MSSQPVEMFARQVDGRTVFDYTSDDEMFNLHFSIRQSYPCHLSSQWKLDVCGVLDILRSHHISRLQVVVPAFCHCLYICDETNKELLCCLDHEMSPTPYQKPILPLCVSGLGCFTTDMNLSMVLKLLMYKGQTRDLEKTYYSVSLTPYGAIRLEEATIAEDSTVFLGAHLSRLFYSALVLGLFVFEFNDSPPYLFARNAETDAFACCSGEIASVVFGANLLSMIK